MRAWATKLVTCLVSACALFLLPTSCRPGHVSDSDLEQRFRQHEQELDALLAEVQADTNLTTVQPNVVIYAGRRFDLRDQDPTGIEQLGLTKSRLIGYQRRLRDLNLEGGILKGTSGEIEFRVDPGSIWNGDSYKGYWYAPYPPPHILATLDGYRLSKGDENPHGGYSVYRPLKGNWSLYLFINR